ncbi:MAG: hypothetical protein JWL65_4232 [Gammaproteobacteria bacterium]|nr:hypothetical protein [Gammaproteobacteria bacterium]
MTGNSSAAGHGTFDENLLACVEDINKLLAKLGGRYDMTVIMSALTEHLGSALKVLMLRKICDARRAQQLIKNIESSAFLRKPGQPETEALSQETDEPSPGGTSGPQDPDT